MAQVTIYEGKSKKDNRPYKALKIDIGEWSTLYFVKSRFEMDYIEKQLKLENAQGSGFDFSGEE